MLKPIFLHDDVSYDWSGFQKTEKVRKVNDAVIEYIKKFRANYYQERINDVKIDVIKQNLDEIEELSIPSRYELKEFFDIYMKEKPEIDAEELNVIVKALINIINSRNGLSLLNRLSVLDTAQVTALDDILSEWSIFDIKIVLDEIDGRLKVINAIGKLCSDKTINELHTLHPLVSQAKWLFGVEYDTPNYTSNNTISTVMKKFFNDKKKLNVDVNWSKRPDLVIGTDFTVGISSSDEFDENEITKVGKILIIELKKGGFVIDRNEMNQAEEYADFIYNGNALNAKPKIKVFVVGDSVSPTIRKQKKYL